MDGFGPIRQFIAFDLETTGLSAAMDRIVEIAAVRFLETGEEIARFQTLVNPRAPCPTGRLRRSWTARSPFGPGAHRSPGLAGFPGVSR